VENLLLLAAGKLADLFEAPFEIGFRAALGFGPPRLDSENLLGHHSKRFSEAEDEMGGNAPSFALVEGNAAGGNADSLAELGLGKPGGIA